MEIAVGSAIELNDTLQLTCEQGFPAEILDLERHKRKAIRLEDLQDLTFSFENKEGARLFHLEPVRVYLVQNLGGKWLFWGHVYMQSQTIAKALDAYGQWHWVSSGTYKIVELYDPLYQEIFTKRESPAGKSYFL